MGLGCPVAVKSSITLMIALVALTGCAASDPRGPEAAAVLDDAVSDGGPGCSAAVAEEGEVVWTYARGMADLERSIPIDTTTRFNIGSVSKQFTATAALILAEEGALALTDSVADHIDGLPPWAAEVTVADLMTHTSGIFDLSFGSPDEIIDREDRLRILDEHPDAHREPESFRYANDNYVLLGLIVEEAGGEGLDEWMREHVFAAYDVDMVVQPGAVADDVALGYEEGAPPFTQSPKTYMAPGPTGIIASPSELARWGDHYREPEVLPAGELERALSAAPPVDGPDSEWRYGPGVFVSEDGMILHGGQDAGIATSFAVSPDRRTTVALSCNWRIWNPDETVTALHEIWFGEDPDTP